MLGRQNDELVRTNADIVAKNAELKRARRVLRDRLDELLTVSRNDTRQHTEQARVGASMCANTAAISTLVSKLTSKVLQVNPTESFRAAPSMQLDHLAVIIPHAVFACIPSHAHRPGTPVRAGVSCARSATS